MNLMVTINLYIVICETIKFVTIRWASYSALLVADDIYILYDISSHHH